MAGSLLNNCSCFAHFYLILLLVHFASSSTTVNSSAHRSWAIHDISTGRKIIAGLEQKVVMSTFEGCINSSSSTITSINFPNFGLAFLQTELLDPNSYVLGMIMSFGPELLSDFKYVWFADLDKKFGENATLSINAKGTLVLKDVDGTVAWSPNTSGFHVKSMNLTCDGNFILFNESGGVVWQSFDHPSHTWLPGQTLKVGQRLTSLAEGNFSRGLYYLAVEKHSLIAYADTNPPIKYASDPNSFSCETGQCFRFIGEKVSFSGFDRHNFTYIQLERNGHLKLLKYNMDEVVLADLYNVDDCEYPLICGHYGVCTSGGNCACPEGTDDRLKYFHPSDSLEAHSGCSLFSPWTCKDAHAFIELKDMTYFAFESSVAMAHDLKSCQKACLDDCSCKAAIFRYGENTSSGDCSLPLQLLTLSHNSDPYSYNVTTFVKVKMQSQSSPLMIKLLLSILGGLLFVALCGVCSCVTVAKRRRGSRKSACPSDVVIDSVAKFSFDTLRLATQDFQVRLGRGGFGSVFEGTLEDGAKVAVKRLDSVGQGRKEFIAEVNTIGNLHHFNLVKLIGFCDDGLHRLLVYEYMQKGSLDKWIFSQDLGQTLSWPLRNKIIIDVAKGLEYLHENCHQNVIHFDIKPQNILLDEDYNVKISDFGLAKMVERDQSQVVTILRGTPGYIAPEIMNGGPISVKVDVYSFGILVLEIVCGRRNFGSSEDDSLTNMVKVKADGNHLDDLIDERVKDMEQHKEEALKMLKIAIWCLQPHFTRPTMSTVVTVLQDIPDMEALTDHGYLTMVPNTTPVVNFMNFSAPPTDCLLSGPR